jgi:hypothetical protein
MLYIDDQDYVGACHLKNYFFCYHLLTWICPLGTHGLVYRVRPIKEVDKYKDSKIDLETKKEGSNPYSTRTLIKP